MKKQFIYQNHSFEYFVYGKGKPVVLLHGFGEDSSIFQHQINFLQEHCLLIIPDLPGSGFSSFNPNLKSIKDYATAVNALLEFENIQQCIMMGHSMGGYITLAFAEFFSEKLSAFGLLHSTAFADSLEKKEVRRRGIELIEEYGPFSFLKTTIPNLFSSTFKETNSDEVASLIEKGESFTKEALQNYYTIMMNRPDRSFVLKNNQKPVLFVIGTEDVAVPLHDILQQTYLPDCSYVHVLDKVGHMGMLEAKEKFNNFLLSFIDKSG